MKTKTLGSRGFTLLELAFVLGIIITLVAIFSPLAMDKLGQSKLTKAQADIDAIATALTSFFSDLGNFPSCDAADCDPNSDSTNNMKFLAVCTGLAACTSEYPAVAASTWGTLTTQESATPARNNFYNHVAINNPNADGTVADATLKDYKLTKWKGPYITKLGPDPWGNAYIIHIGAIQSTGCAVDAAGGAGCGTASQTAQGWILSAGPDGTLQTGPNAASLGGDDIGYIFCTNC
ncbi:MAG TPA: hypothetical protein VGL11_09865 [Candidatus Binatia bacterium]